MRATTSSTSRSDTVLRRGRAQAHRGAGLVEHVDGLVRQEAVGEVAHGEFDAAADRRLRVAHAVVLLVLRRQPLEDADALLCARLLHVHALEAARERAVALEVPVLGVGGRAHAAQLAALEDGLQHVRGVHGGALRRAGPEDRVDLVDEEHRVRALLDRADEGLEGASKSPR